MFDVLDNYENNGHFFLHPDSVFTEVCNAPKKGVGVYLVYALVHGRVVLKCVKACGESLSKKNKDEGGLYNHILNSTFRTKPHRWIWQEIMNEQGIDALDIYWYVTNDKKVKDHPLDVKADILVSYLNVHGTIPPWSE